MNKNQQFDNILNTCLDRLLKGETAEQCLRDYPEQAKELEPLLRTAIAARVASTIQPRNEFKARARYEFQSALREMAAPKARRSWFSGWRWQWQSGWTVAVIAVLLVVTAGAGTVAAAVNSMPDSALYTVKLATERVQATLTFSDIGKASLNARFAERRVDEIVYLAANGQPQQVQAIAMRLNSNLVRIGDLVGQPTSPGAFSAGSAPGNETDASARTEQTPGITAQSVPAAAPLAIAPPSAAAGPDVGPLAPSTTVTAPPDVFIPRSTSPAPTVKEQYQPDFSGVKATGIDKLKQDIIKSAIAQPAKLEEALGTAPAEMRPVLRQALTQALAEYDKLIKSLAGAPATEQ